MCKRPLTLLFFAVLTVCVVYLNLFAPPYVNPYTEKDREEVTLTGRLVRKEYRLDEAGEKEGILYLRSGKRAVTAQVYPGIPVEELPAIGQEITARGTLRIFEPATNPGAFDAETWYRKKKVAFCVYQGEVLSVRGSANLYREALFALQLGIGNVLDQVFDERSAGVMKAMLIGDRASLDDELKELYRQNGILHILAVSGLHISFFGTLLLKVFQRARVPVRAGIPVVIAVMISYGLLCGMTTSAFRAVMMFSLKEIAPLLRRSYDMLSAMSLAGLSILCEEVLYATDAGFLLSFGAIAGLGFVDPALRKEVFFQRHKAFSACLSVTLATLPVYHLFFFTFPVYAVFLNLLVLPLAGIALGAGWLAVCAGALSVGMGKILCIPVRLILFFYEKLCLGGVRLPFSSCVTGCASWVQVTLYLVLLGTFVFYCNRRKENAVFLWKGALLSVAVAVLFFRNPPELRITAIDVGQGDGIVIQMKDRAFLIDGGSSSQNAVGKYQLMPFLRHEGIGTLDGIFISHEDEDHVSGVLEILKAAGQGGINVKTLFLPEIGEEARGENYRSLLQAAKESNIPVRFLHKGQVLEAGEARFRCLGPDTEGYYGGANASSMILHFSYGVFQALFTGDVEEEGLYSLNRLLREVPAKYRDLDLLKVAHHGSRYTTDEEFLSLVDAAVSLISCGRNNRYGHPHEELLTRLAADGSAVYRTDLGGALIVDVKKGGSSFTVRPFIKNHE